MIMMRLARTLRRDESGMAMVMVISIGSVLTLLVVAAIAIALGGMRSARNDQHWNGALAAAFAGVEEYQSRLAADPNYARFGNPAAAFSADSGSAVSLPPASRSNAAFATGTTGTWAPVAGSELGETTATATFRYEVDNSTFATTGTVSLRSTGRVGQETRTVVSTLRVNSFLDYLYFTDYEIEDPAAYGALSAANCTKYGYTGRPTGTGDSIDNCHDISFGTSDSLEGPVHSNDVIRACSSTFSGPVTTAYAPTTPGALLYKRQTSSGAACAASTFLPGFPASRAAVVMPATNTALKLETNTDLAVEPGCLYSGPTRIVFHGDGTVTVRSPWTRATRVSGPSGSVGSTPAACGVPGVAGLGSASGATFAVPESTVFYVQDVSAVVGDPNFWAASATPTLGTAAGGSRALACTGADGSGSGNGVGYPVAHEVLPTGSAAYGCRVGDAFVEGTLRGSLTVATARYLYITADIRYQDTGRDVLGLVGDGAVIVSNPVDSAGNSLLSAATRTNRTIHAAILSVQHTFQVQNVGQGGLRGKLTIRGAIAQKFRGTVYRSTGSGGSLIAHGYTKDYHYDARFGHLTPPRFLQPVSTSYGVTAWIEVGTAYTASGAAR